MKKLKTRAKMMKRWLYSKRIAAILYGECIVPSGKKLWPLKIA
jgi:hypothetical protein